MSIFFGWTFNTVWEFIASSASIATIIGGCAVAVAVLLPKQLDFITDLRKWAIVVAVVAFSYSAVAGKFYNDGLQVKQAEWDAAIDKEAVTGETARDDAVAAVPAVTSDRSMFRGDPWNRDEWGQQPAGRTKGALRWLAPSQLFGR